MVMCKLSRKIVDRTIILEWEKPKTHIGDFQDYYGLDEKGNLCSIELQLLHNVGSKILHTLPSIFDIKEDLNISKINIRDFSFSNEDYSNIQQYLYKNTLIFKYTDKYEKDLVYKRVADDTFLIMNKVGLLQYIVLRNIDTFSFRNRILLDNTLVALIFNLYTYLVDDIVQVMSLLKEIEEANLEELFYGEVQDLKEELLM